MKNKNLMVGDINKLNKVIRKAKEEAESSKICYRRKYDFKILKIYANADARFKTQDDRVRSVEGRILFLNNGNLASPILWKAKNIGRVADSTRTAETLSMDDAIYLARMIREIYTRKKSLTQIPVVLFMESKPLHDSIFSTKQVDRKTIRNIIHMMKDSITRGEVHSFKWLETKAMITDVFTKESAPTELIKQELKKGRLDLCVNRGQR